MRKRLLKGHFRAHWLLAGAICLLVCAASPSPAQVQATQPEEAVLRNALVVGVAMGLPGISLAIGNDKGLAWSGTAGYSDLVRRMPLKPDDRFCLGSITKTFVAVVILQLVQEGKLDLDKTPADYLDDELVLRTPNAGTAKLRHLLNHQSGIPTWEFQKEWIRKGRGDRMALGHVWGKTETLEYSTEDVLRATNAPGARYAYSNTNYTILGLIIEKVTGNDAAAEIRRRIHQPLGLANTFLESFEDIPGGYVRHYHYATPAFESAAGVHRGFTEIRPLLVESSAANLSPEWTAGGMLSSAEDLFRFARALKNGELLGSAMQKEMFTYSPPAEGGGGRSEYMLGISRTKRAFQDYTSVGHGGGTLGFTARMAWLEEPGVIVIMLVNVGGMHSGLSPSPVSLFYDQVLLPAVMRYMGQQK
jgi:D-alanyl-D-alanine carboxypeptidase